jgi:hypothetical protein
MLEDPFKVRSRVNAELQLLTFTKYGMRGLWIWVLDPFIMVGLVGTLEKVAALESKYLTYPPSVGRSELDARKGINYGGGRKTHRTHLFALITITLSIITVALVSRVHPAVATLRRGW